MVVRAADAVRPSLVKSLSKNRDNLDESFIDFCLNYKNFKEDTIATEKISVEVLNEDEENGISKVSYNDILMEDTNLE